MIGEIIEETIGETIGEIIEKMVDKIILVDREDMIEDRTLKIKEEA